MLPKNTALFIILFYVTSLTLYAQELTIAESEENDVMVEELGYFIQNQIHENNPEGYMSKFDISYIVNSIKVLENGSESSEDYKKGFLKGITNGISDFPYKIIQEVENGTFYDFVNYRYDPDIQTYYLLFRLFGSDFGINYHEYRIIKKDDEFMFNDIYVYLSGENFSSTFARVFTFSSDLFQNETNTKFNKLSKVFIDIKAGNTQNAYDIMANLTEDEELSKHKFLHILKIQIAQQLSNQDYIDAVEDLKRNFENDPTIYLTLIDYYIIKEDYNTALNLVDNLQEETSDDFLNYIKGNLTFLKGDYAQAEQHFNYMIENYAGFYLPYFSNISALSLQKKYDAATQLLNKIIEITNYSKPELIEFIEGTEEDGSNELDGLINSSSYKKWKRKR